VPTLPTSVARLCELHETTAGLLTYAPGE